MSTSQHSNKSTPILLPSRYDITGDRAANELSDQQIDIWEHGALLYHGYEWQAAADTFSMLAQSIKSVERRTLCLLNAGLIQARLGDYDAASATFEEANEIDQTFAITAFLVGINSYELRDIAKAEGCLEMCLNGLAYGDVNHLDVDMDFVLHKDAVRENLRNIRNAQFNIRFVKITVSDLAPLNTVPAECIFEAPPRMEHVSRKSSEPQGFRRIFGGKRSEIFESPISTQGNRSSASTIASLESIPILWRPPTRPTASPGGNILLSIPENPDTASPPLAKPAILSTSAPTPGGTVERPRMSWHRRPSTPYTPRDARGERPSMTELNRFARAAGPGKYWNLAPKDATGEYESTGELAYFATSYDPDEIHESALPKPFHLDPYALAILKRDRELKQDYEQVKEAQGNPTPTSSNITGSILNVRRRNSAPASPQTSNGAGAADLPQYADEITTSPLSYETANGARLELLKPAVYKPYKEKMKRSIPSDSDRTANGSSTKELDLETPPTSASTIGSHRSSITDTKHRIKNVHEPTLRQLVGSAESPTEDIHSTSGHSNVTSPKSVDTVNFFEYVWRWRK